MGTASQSQYYLVGDPLSSAWQSLQQQNGACLPVNPGDMTTCVQSGKWDFHSYAWEHNTQDLFRTRKKHQRLRSQPVYWGRKRVLVAETIVLLVFITNAVSEVFTFTSQAGVAKGQGGSGISLELYLKANPISTKGL